MTNFIFFFLIELDVAAHNILTSEHSPSPSPRKSKDARKQSKKWIAKIDGFYPFTSGLFIFYWFYFGFTAYFVKLMSIQTQSITVNLHNFIAQWPVGSQKLVMFFSIYNIFPDSPF